MERGSDGPLEPLMAVAHYQAYPTKASRDERAEKGEPEGAVLARPHVQAEHLPLARGGAAHGDDDRHAAHAAAECLLTHLDERGVQPQVGILTREPPRPELL